MQCIHYVPGPKDQHSLLLWPFLKKKLYLFPTTEMQVRSQIHFFIMQLRDWGLLAITLTEIINGPITDFPFELIAASAKITNFSFELFEKAIWSIITCQYRPTHRCHCQKGRRIFITIRASRQAQNVTLSLQQFKIPCKRHFHRLVGKNDPGCIWSDGCIPVNTVYL